MTDQIYPEGSLGALVQRMREQLVPKGSLPLVRLQLRNHGFVAQETVAEAISQLEAHACSSVLSGPLTGLEKLGLTLLLDTIGYDWPPR